MEWVIKPLGELVTFERGLTYSKSDEAEYSSNGVLRSNNVDLETNSLNLGEIKYLNADFIIPSSKKVVRNSLLMCMSNGSKSHLGKVALIEDDLDYAFGGFMGLLKPIETVILPRYLYYSLISPAYKKHIQSLSDGANINNLKYKDLSVFPVMLPMSLSEQQRIVDILDAEFAKIDALKENTEKNLQNAKDLFQAVLRKELEPKDGWDEKTLKQIGVTQTGTTPKTSEKNNYGDYIPFIKPADINVDGLGGLNYENEGLSRLGAQKGRIFTANSVLMVCIGATIGKVGFSTKEVSSNQQINILSPYKDNCKYIYYCMASPKFQQEVIKEGESAKATLPIINKSKWENLKIHIPPLSVQNQIVDILDTLSAKCKSLQGNYDKTATLCSVLKQALLRKAFNGEL